jgi:hypothetical protein
VISYVRKKIYKILPAAGKERGEVDPTQTKADRRIDDVL